MTWQKLPPIKDHVGGCLNCDHPGELFDLDRIIAVGFGSAGVSRDGQTIADGEQALHRQNEPDGHLLTGAVAENLAAVDPEHDWRIYLHGPLSDRVYQRHAPGQWVLVERGQGFA